MKYMITVVHDGDRTLQLMIPIVINVVKLKNKLFRASGFDGVISTGVTKEEAIREFHHDLIVLWHEVALCDNADLTLDAIDLKRQLVALVKKV